MTITLRPNAMILPGFVALLILAYFSVILVGVLTEDHPWIEQYETPARANIHP